jgi:hypothetical protein
MLQGYRSSITHHLLPAFGAMPVEALTAAEIEQWIPMVQGSVRLRNKLLILLHGILGRAAKVYGLTANAAIGVEKFPAAPQRRHRGVLPEEVGALVRAADLAQDAAIYRLPRSPACGWVSCSP